MIFNQMSGKVIIFKKLGAHEDLKASFLLAEL